MFAKLSALMLVLPFVSALTILPIQSGTPGGSVTIEWTATTDDPAYFSIELQNPSFNKQYAIANNVQTSLGQLTITLPQVPAADDYQLVAIATNNVNDVLSTSSTFSITTSTTTSSSASSTTSGTSTSTSSGTESTPSATSTGPASTVSSAVLSTASSATGSAASSAASSTPSILNKSNGAAAFKVPGMVPAAAILLSAVAGAAMVF